MVNLNSKLGYLVSFLPFLTSTVYFFFSGGYSVDDWGQLPTNQSVINQINSWREIWAFRPVAWFFIPSMTQIFNSSFHMLLILHLTLFALGVHLIVGWKSLRLSNLQKSLSIILITLPSISSAMFFSPVNQLSASLSIFLVGLSIHIGDKYDGGFYRFSSTLFLTLGILTYEVILPILILIMIFDLKAKYYRKAIYSLRVPVVLFFVIIWQKIIAPAMFVSTTSRLSTLDTLSGVSYFVAYLVSFPIQLVSVLINTGDLFPIIISIISILGLIKYRSYEATDVESNSKFLFAALAFAFCSNSLFFLLSGNYAEINSYQNRGLTCSWIIFSLILAKFLSCKNAFSSLVLSSVIVTNGFLFHEKIQTNIEASSYRTALVSQIESVYGSFYDYKVLIIDAPCVVPLSTFRIEVFCTAWDAKGALALNDIDIPIVLLAQDPGFLNLYRSLQDETKIVFTQFNSKFQLVKVEKFDNLRAPGALMLESDSVTLTNRRESGLNECKRYFLNPTKSVLNMSFLQCLRDPLQARQTSRDSSSKLPS